MPLAKCGYDNDARKLVGAELRRLAKAVLGAKVADVELEVVRPVRELDPMAGECEFDNMRHFAPGLVETWTLTLKHARPVRKCSS